MNNNVWRWIVLKWTQSWGANAGRGHTIMLLIGASVASLDLLWLKVMPNISLVGVLAAFVIFPPLLLPARANDPKKEWWQSFILTFATSSVFGILAGFVGCAWFVDFSAMTESPQSLSTAWTLSAAIAVCVSYWMAGQMSRNWQATMVAQYGSVPANLGRFILAAKTAGLLAQVDAVLKALALYQHKVVLQKGGPFEQICRDLEAYSPDSEWGNLFDRARREIEDWPRQLGSPVDVLSLPGSHDDSNVE